MIKYVIKGLAKGKARFACAVAGVAIATGTLVFMTSLVKTNEAQAERRAAALLQALPLEDGQIVQMALDYRPDGHVMQGPPLMGVVAVSSVPMGYDAIVSRSLFATRHLPVPPVGTKLKLVGRNGTYTVEVGEYLDWDTPVRGVPNIFVSAACAEDIGEEWQDYAVPSVEDLAPLLKGDDERRMDFATPLLLVAALLTALSLLVNSLLLSIEANRRTIATLRTIGLTRFGTVRFVTTEALLSVAVGWILGVLGSAAALAVYVACDPVSFPSGLALDAGRIRLTLLLMPVTALLAVVFALAPALKVRAMDATATMPRPRRHGMAITFALGFAAFVAVEVWGASLMRAFIPSPEWPDAIVSILPAGASSYDVDKLRDVEGVRRVSELVPRQLYIKEEGKEFVLPKYQGPMQGSGSKDVMKGRMKLVPNTLFLAAEFLPRFRFLEGDWESAKAALESSDAVVIERMLSNAYNLHRGDRLVCVQAGRGGALTELSFPIAGVVDLNWHMVTSRGLVRGLNRMPKLPSGVAFCSFDTMGAIDPRTYLTEPSHSAPMTHLWVEYEPEFLAKHGVFEAGRLIEAEIAKRLGDREDSTVRLHARDEIADGTLAHGSDIIGQVARIPFVFLAILSIGFVAMLVAEADSRRREFAVLRAVGATKGQLAWRLTKSAIRTAAIGILCGLPVGALAGWLASFKTASIWPGMPHWFVLPYPVVLEGALGALVFALLFAIPTAMSIIRTRN